MARLKRWSGQMAYVLPAVDGVHAYTNVVDLFPPASIQNTTVLHVRFQPTVCLSAQRVSGGNTPTSVAWDDISIAMWTWLNRTLPAGPVDLGPVAATDMSSDTRLLTTDTLSPRLHYTGANPVSEATIYTVDGGVSAESRRISHTAEDGDESVSVGFGLFDGFGIFAVGGVSGGIEYDVFGKFMLRVLWEGDSV